MDLNKKNFFNGEFLNYYIDINFYLKIKKKFNFENFNLYKKSSNNNVVELVPVIPNKYYIVPIGLFSNKDFVLKCVWEKNDKKFLNLMNKNITSNIVLYDVQKKIISEFEKTLDEITKVNSSPAYINLVGNCSIGKTIMAIQIIFNLKYKTFVVTPTLELAKQWKKEIDNFLKNVNCIVSLQGVQKLLKNKDIYDCDILIIPYKHLSNDVFNNFLSNNFTIGVIDEQHTYNLESNNILRSFLSFNSFSVMLSLTATPRHENKFYLGREINLENIIKEFKVFTFKKKCFEVILKDPSKILSFKKTENYNKFLSFSESKKQMSKKDVLCFSIIKKRVISEDENRIHNIVNTIVETFFNNKEIENPKILVLTKFINEINVYYERLINTNNKLEKYIHKIYAKKNKENELETFSVLKNFLEKKNKYIIIGTEDSLGTGIDLKDLNILHLTSVTTNVNNLIQYAGRICRENNTATHQLYYYNIITSDKIKIHKDVETMRETLKKNNWMCILKKI